MKKKWQGKHKRRPKSALELEASAAEKNSEQSSLTRSKSGAD
jgi:hypothetical protein